MCLCQHREVDKMSYSIDIQKRALSFISSGGSQKEAIRIFGVSRKTLYNWLYHPRLSSTTKRTRLSKLNKAALAAHVREHPDALLRERAAHFGVRPNTVWYALQQLRISKKND